MRKKWTPRTDSTNELLLSREKRKWQIALRRYIFEGQASPAYAGYFGVEMKRFREWIALQFNDGMDWSNFSTSWQLDHLVPLSFFDLGKEEDKQLAWNFLNIRVSPLKSNGGVTKLDLISARRYFEKIFSLSGYNVAEKMVLRLEEYESAAIRDNDRLFSYLSKSGEELSTINTLSAAELYSLNAGQDLSALLLEKEALKKWE